MTNSPYFEPSSESHPNSIPWMWRFIRNFLITFIITGSIDHSVQTKTNLDSAIDSTFVHTRTVVDGNEATFLKI